MEDKFQTICTECKQHGVYEYKDMKREPMIATRNGDRYVVYASKVPCKHCGFGMIIDYSYPDNYEIKTIADLVNVSYSISVEKGWHEQKRNFGEAIALIHSELSEALESYRRNEPTIHIGDNGKPEGIASELADVVIRVADLCGELNIDLADAINLKTKYNRTRPYRHGGKKC